MKTFRSELIRNGIEKRTANMLAEEFLRAADAFSIRNLSTMF